MEEGRFSGNKLETRRAFLGLNRLLPSEDRAMELSKRPGFYERVIQPREEAVVEGVLTAVLVAETALAAAKIMSGEPIYWRAVERINPFFG